MEELNDVDTVKEKVKEEVEVVVKTKSRVKREDLEILTQNAASTGALALSLMLASKCPIPELYEVVEDHLRHNERMRKDLGFAEAIPAEIISGHISTKIGEIVAKMKTKVQEKGKVGFQIPTSNDPESDPSKMN